MDTSSFLISLGISLMTSFTCLSLFNTFIQWTGTLFGFVNFGLVMILTYFFIPFLYLLGIPWIQIFQVNFFLFSNHHKNDLAPNVCIINHVTLIFNKQKNIFTVFRGLCHQSTYIPSRQLHRRKSKKQYAFWSINSKQLKYQRCISNPWTDGSH